MGAFLEGLVLDLFLKFQIWSGTIWRALSLSAPSSSGFPPVSPAPSIIYTLKQPSNKTNNKNSAFLQSKVIIRCVNKFKKKYQFHLSMPGTYFTSKLCLDLTLVWMMMLSCITGLSVTLKWRRYKTKSRNDNYGWHGIRTKTIYTLIIPVSSKPWIASLCSPTPHQPWASATAPQDAQAWKHWGEYELKTQSFNCKRNSCQSGQLQTDPCGICLQCAPGVCSFFLASANFSTAICDVCRRIF